MKKYCSIIYNPATANFKPKELDQTASVFIKEYEVDKRQSEYQGHVLSLVKDANQDSDLIVTFGGDGTFGEAVSGIFDQNQLALLSHIPAGTTNDLKRTFKLSSSPTKSAELILQGEEQNIDIFTLNDQPFSYVGAFGFLANVPCNTAAKVKAQLGHLAYLITGFKELITKPKVYDITCKVGEEEWSEEYITGIITNSFGFGGMTLLDDIDLNDGLVEVSLIKNISHKEMLIIARDIILKRFNVTKYPDLITHFKTAKANISFKANTPKDGFDLDGEKTDVLQDKTDFDIKMGRKLKLLLPKR